MSARPDSAATNETGEETAALYRRYARPLRSWLARRVTASPALVEGACASAWLILVAKRLRLVVSRSAQDRSVGAAASA
jgi:hypothetical protein